MAVSGMSVAFPIAFGLAWVVGGVLQFFVQPGLNPMMSFGGAFLILVSVVLGVMAYRWWLQEENERIQQALRDNPGTKQPARKSGVKAFILASVAGLLFSGFFPLVQQSVYGDDGVFTLRAALLIAGAIFGSSIVIVPFFLNSRSAGRRCRSAATSRSKKATTCWACLAGCCGPSA